MSEITPFEIAISDAQIADLQQRLALTRWPDAETVDDWSQGIPLAYVREVADYWAKEYDWRAREAKLNRFPQFKTKLSGLDIHFIHVRSPEPEATPLVMTHGWPGSVVEFQKVIEPADEPDGPRRRGEGRVPRRLPVAARLRLLGQADGDGLGCREDRRHVGRADAPLGYERYVAQGGDWGAMVTTCIGAQDPEHCLGIHLNMPIAPPTEDSMNDLSELEKSALAGFEHYQQWDSGYSKQQSTRPQSLGYGLSTRRSARRPGSSRSSGAGQTATATRRTRSPATSCSTT